MENECSIVRDLLPLYVEKMVRSDTACFVQAHLENCGACRSVFEQAKEPQPVQTASDATPIRSLRRRLTAKKIQIIVLTALIATALLVSGFAALDAPDYFPYSEHLLSVMPVGDGGLYLSFHESVTDFDYHIYPDPEGGELYYCDIEAWTSLWDKWISKDKATYGTVIWPEEPYPMVVRYVPNDGSENIYVYGKTGTENSITLPRLALGYYFVLAVLILTVLLTLRWLLGKKKKMGLWLERGALLPAAYILGHVFVMGFHFASYAMLRDWTLILFASILLYCCFLLAHGMWRRKREHKQIEL